jgi:hypothetical protein
VTGSPPVCIRTPALVEGDNLTEWPCRYGEFIVGSPRRQSGCERMPSQPISVGEPNGGPEGEATSPCRERPRQHLE